jgi:NADPH-dependent 2,4-dienoyl-CoA reductase/sulfur reductase-like enzyme
VRIDPVEHRVTLEDQSSSISTLSYDQLIIATGARPKRPAISGSDLPGVFFLHTMDESFQMQEYLSTHPVRTALIVGGGYIGLEMADALTLRGLSVTLVGHGQSLLKTVDPDLGALVQRELERHGVTVSTGIAIKSIEASDAGLCVQGTDGFEASADLVLLAVGVEPRTELAQTAGVEMGKQGAIRVTRRMETSVPAILAAGDCVET